MNRTGRLVAILAGAVVTVGIIVVMFVSTSGVTQDAVPTAPTVAQLDKGVPASWTAKVVGDLGVRNGCLVLDVDGSDRFVVWPTGWHKDGDAILTEDDRRITPGTTIAGTGALVSGTALVNASDQYSQYVSDMLGRCVPSSAPKQPVAVLVAVDEG